MGQTNTKTKDAPAPDKTPDGHLKKPVQTPEHGEVGEALDETFPASDPPAFNAGDAGEPEKPEAGAIPPGQKGKPEPNPGDPKKQE